MSAFSVKSPDGLSICIPNWNHRNYLARSISSALATSRALRGQGIECEILVIDDFSRDGSQRLLLSMAMMDATGALHAVLLKQNQGLGQVRNLAMQQARYKWVCFLDADNELYADNVAYFFRGARDTGAALVYGNLISRTDNRILGLVSNDVVHEGILIENYIDALCLVDAEQILELGGYYNPYQDPSMQGHEDWELLLHLIAEDKQIVLVPMTLGKYHVIEGSMIKESPLKPARIHRIFDQRKVGLPARFRSRVYHPDVGYII